MSTVTRDRVGVGDYLKRLLVGRALASHRSEHQLLPKSLALPVFASDQLSSVAYATEEMMLVLVLAGTYGLRLLMPLGVGIAILLVIVIASYRQTVRAYPRGGGSYIVARENLGTIFGLTAAGAILTSYVLTVAVSVTAGAIAVTSAVPDLAARKVTLAVAFIALITVANLRGAKEAGKLFAIPTYGFVVAVGITVSWGLWRCVSDACPSAATATLSVETSTAFSLFIVLRAFSSGATALTGVEAIADGVQAFRRPQSRNAAATLLLMGSMSIPMFLGITMLADLLDVRVNDEIAATKSVLARIGETVFAGEPMFLVLQVFTALILILAANTSYQDFPRLSSILARDRFMPSQFRNRGDRLVFSNGILVLSLLAAALVWAFEADLTRLIQLYVVGVFIALTLSQAGMVRWQLARKDPGWRGRAALNVIGGLTTGLVLAIVGATRFALGAWMVIAALPFLIAFFLAVHHHYERIGAVLRVPRIDVGERPRNTFLLLVPDLGPATLEAIGYLRALRPERSSALYVGPPDAFADVAVQWERGAARLGELRPLAGAHEHPIRAVRDHLRAMPHAPDEFVTVVIPELLTGASWFQFVRRRAGLLLKTSLLFEPGVVVTDVPLLPEERAGVEAHADRPVEPNRSVVLIPVSAVHEATVRAVVYAKSLNPAVVEGLFFVTDPEEHEGIVEAWHDRGLDVPLVLVEAPFRDLGEPLLAEVRKHTLRGDTIVTVVLPELIPAHWWENLLHNQTAFFFKRLLLFEPGVVVTSTAFHLRAPEVALTPTA